MSVAFSRYFETLSSLKALQRIHSPVTMRAVVQQLYITDVQRPPGLSHSLALDIARYKLLDQTRKLTRINAHQLRSRKGSGATIPVARGSGAHCPVVGFLLATVFKEL